MYVLSQILLVAVVSIAAFFILRWMAYRMTHSYFRKPRWWERPQRWQQGGGSYGDVAGRPVRPKGRPPMKDASAAATPEPEPPNLVLRGNPLYGNNQQQPEDRKAS